MSDTDYLETLNNAELRAKCTEYGLPNVPVTDSSRKLLIKKLRVSIGGEIPAAQGTPKKSNRRESTNASKPQSEKGVDVTEQNVEQRARGRRTIAATTDVEKKNERNVKDTSPVAAPASIRGRRRSSVKDSVISTTVTSNQKKLDKLPELEEEQNSILPIVTKRIVSNKPEEVTIPKAIPTESLVPVGRETRKGNRQTDVGKTKPEQVQPDQSASPLLEQQPIKTAYAQAQQPLKATKLPEERPLSASFTHTQQPFITAYAQAQQSLKATKLAEQQPLIATYSQARQPLKAPELSEQHHSKKNVLMSNSYIVLDSEDEDADLIETAKQVEQDVLHQSIPKGPDHAPTMGNTFKSTLSNRYTNIDGTYKKAFDYAYPPKESSVIEPISSHSTLGAQKYGNNSYASSSSFNRYTVGTAGTSTITPSRQYNPNFDTEYGSGNVGLEDEPKPSISTPYLSSFTRSLERMKAEGIYERDNPSRYRRSIATPGHMEHSARRQMRQNDDDDVKRSFKKLCRNLNKKYKIQTILIAVAALLLITAIYVKFF